MKKKEYNNIVLVRPTNGGNDHHGSDRSDVELEVCNFLGEGCDYGTSWSWPKLSRDNFVGVNGIKYVGLVIGDRIKAIGKIEDLMIGFTLSKGNRIIFKLREVRELDILLSGDYRWVHGMNNPTQYANLEIEEVGLREISLTEEERLWVMNHRESQRQSIQRRRAVRRGSVVSATFHPEVGIK